MASAWGAGESNIVFFLVKLSASETMQREQVLFRVCISTYPLKMLLTFWEISLHINVGISICLSIYHLLYVTGFLKRLFITG